MKRSLLLAPVCLLALSAAADDFPIVPDDVAVSLYASEPLVRNPCAITFDARGRLCVGMGPQYRKPKPDTPGDSVWILLDEDGDGAAEARKRFATGFNSIQGLAWRGRDLYVANAPELTIARDLDGDDEADEYVRLYTDLGNLEHGLHGLQFGPDGKLYMSKGNSKGLTKPPARVAPAPFRELWGVQTPGLPEFPEPVTFRKGEYRKNYHDPADDWGLCGGVLRCDPDGTNLEIVSRGFRNPWDICFDDEFTWLGTDNDQTHGDKIFSPFFGAHFGWGHPWSYDWKGDDHLPTAPSAGPLFEGSGTGVVFCGLPHYPEKYRGVFLVNDWLRREVLIHRPKWKGAWLQADRAKLEVFAHAGGGRSMAMSSGRRFDPVDIETGPDGAIYISSWGREYGLKEEDGRQVNEGRIYRLWPKAAPPSIEKPTIQRERPIRHWPLEQVYRDLGSHLPARRTDAQEEIIRRQRGQEFLTQLESPDSMPTALETWALWTLGRQRPDDVAHEEWLAGRASAGPGLNRRIQAIRILAHRSRERGDGLLALPLRSLLADPEPRIRHEVILAMRQAGETRWSRSLIGLLADESDRVVYYSAWGALRDLLSDEERTALLDDQRRAVHRAALLALLEDDKLPDDEIARLARDPDPRDPLAAALARKRLGGKHQTEIRGASLAQPGAGGMAVDHRPVSVVSSLGHLPGRRYEEAVLQSGTKAYTDRPYRITALPDELDGLTFIRSANQDADAASGPFLELHLRYPSTVFLADDVRGGSLPRWARGRWNGTDLSLRTEDASHALYRSEHPAGKLLLGANRDEVAGRKSNYLVIVQPRLLAPPARPTTSEDVLPLLKKADRQRGRALFLSKTGAACSTCHQLEGIGNVFAPDLAEIGSRTDATFLIRSILEPSAEITEGFAMQVVTKKNSEAVGGIVLEETGRHLKIALVNGSVVTVPKSEIVNRQTAPLSAMPPTFAGMLTPQDVADITAYLLAPKDAPEVVAQQPAPPAGSTPGKPSRFSGTQWGDKTKGFYLDCHDVRLEIRYDGIEIGSYYYRHSETARPFFAHLKTRSGQQVTRNFPPVAGKDATDHPTMHPGLWLGFANLDGISFWHNKQGVVVPEEFPEEPKAGPKHASFTAAFRYLAPDGREVCREITRFDLSVNDDGYLLTTDSTFTGTANFSFGVKEEMGLGIRMATPLTVKDGRGAILGAAGGEDEKGTWGMADRWWDYFGPLGDRSAGIQVMAGPGNPPVWAHSRDYGVLVANPFPVDRKENRGKTHTVKPGEEFRLRFGIQVHEHPDRADFDPEASYRRYLESVR